VAKKRRATDSPAEERSPTKPPRDFVAIAKAYAADAVANRGGKFGKWVQLYAQRFLSDLKRAAEPDAPFTFDEWHACDACLFIEELPHVEGVWDSPNIVLHPSHVLFVVQLFGFRKLDGTRRFTSALFAVARKNAKSTLASAILLYCECCEDEPGAQVISAATTGSQARIIFNVAKAMATKCHELREAFGLECFANSIARMETGASFKPINAKASTQDGLNPSHVGLDEIHAHKTPDLLNVLKSAAGARRNPLFLYTTTEGFENPGPWGELRHFAKQVLGGIIEAEHFLAVIYAIDGKGDFPEDKEREDDEFDEACWPKANPLMDVNPHLAAAIRKEAIEAKAMPGAHAEFKIKRCNRQSATATGWVDLGKWKACGGAVDLDWLKGKPCWGGLDLASTRDFCSFRLVWRVDGVYYTYGKRWVPADAVHQRTVRGTVNYAGWVKSGYITQTEGDVADYGAIERDIVALWEQFSPRAIAFDLWNATDIVNRLVAAGLPMVQFIQGPKSYHPAMQELERAYIGGQLHHGGDPVLNWCASNLVARTDENMNTSPGKKKSPDKIDDMTALLEAIGVSLNDKQEKSFWETAE
jgi:phage terminase large subunit-like protein